MVLEEHVTCKGPAWCAHYLWLGISRLELFDAHTAERSLMKVEWPGEHPGKRDCQFVLGGATGLIPLVILEVEHPLTGQQIWVGPLQPCRLGRPVERYS